MMKGMRYVTPIMLILSAAMLLWYSTVFLSTNPPTATLVELCIAWVALAGASASIILIGFGLYVIQLGGRIE